MPQARAGKIKLLAQTSGTRSTLTPDTPTIAESGLPGFQSDIWFALLAPAGTSAPIVARLNKALNDALTAPDTLARLQELGGDAMGGTAERAVVRMRDDQIKWLKIMKDVGIKPE